LKISSTSWQISSTSSHISSTHISSHLITHLIFSSSHHLFAHLFNYFAQPHTFLARLLPSLQCLRASPFHHRTTEARLHCMLPWDRLLINYIHLLTILASLHALIIFFWLKSVPRNEKTPPSSEKLLYNKRFAPVSEETTVENLGD
jgi:hypothetical protein